MIGFQFYAAGTFQFLIILVQGSILFAKGANRSEHFARRLTLDLLGLFLISLPLTLGYWRIDQAAGSAVLSNFERNVSHSHPWFTLRWRLNSYGKAENL